MFYICAAGTALEVEKIQTFEKRAPDSFHVKESDRAKYKAYISVQLNDGSLNARERAVARDRHLDGVLDQIVYRFPEPSVVAMCDHIEGVHLSELVEHIGSAVVAPVITDDDPQLVTECLSSVDEFRYEKGQCFDLVVRREHDDDHLMLVGPRVAWPRDDRLSVPSIRTGRQAVGPRPRAVSYARNCTTMSIT